MSSPVRVAITFTFVPVVAGALILGLTYSTGISSGGVFAGVAPLTVATSYWLLKKAGVPSGFAVGGALTMTVLSYVLAIAVAIEYLVN